MGTQHFLLLATRCLALNKVNSVRVNDAVIVTQDLEVVGDQLDRTLLWCGDARFAWAVEHRATPTAPPIMIYHI